MKTAIYVRLSQDRGGDHAGVDRQLEDCRRKVEGPVYEFQDNNKSAYDATKSRPQYQALLTAIKEGEVNRVVVWHMDRLYRQMRELCDLTDLAQEGRGVMIDAVTGPGLDLRSADGVMWAQHMVMTAQHESAHKGERVRRAQQQKRDQGLPTGGQRAFGWRDSMTPDTAEAKEIVQAVESLFAGASLKDVARQWNQKGLKRPQRPGSPWDANTVRLVVSNPRHAALLAHDSKRKGSYQRTVIGKAQWPAIVKPERWQALMAYLESRSRTTTGIPKRRSLLTRLVICGKCGTVMSRTKIKSMMCYRCPSSRPEQPKDSKSCGSVSVNAGFLEQLLVDATLERADSGALAKILKALAGDQQKSTKALEALDAIDHRQDKLASMYADGEISDRAFAKAEADIRYKKEQLQKELASTLSSSVVAPYASRKGALRAAWPSLTQDQQREVIRIVIGQVKIMPTNVRGRHSFDQSRVKIAKAK